MVRLILLVAVAWPISALAQGAAYDEDFIQRLNEALAAEGLTEVTASRSDDGQVYTSTSSETEEDIRQSLNVIGRVGEMIAENQCSEAGRPFSITYSLSASFKIVVGVETGTAITWELDRLCERMGF